MRGMVGLMADTTPPASFPADVGQCTPECTHGDGDTAGHPFPGRPGYVTGYCGHAVAWSEWAARFRNCEHCGEGDPEDDEDDLIYPDGLEGEGWPDERQVQDWNEHNAAVDGLVDE
jgi:hypothetical protein